MVTLVFETTTLILKNPNMGNVLNTEFTRISRSSTGGDTIIYRDNDWPKVDKLTLVFELLECNTKIDDLKAFIKMTLGKTFTYTDQNGDIWSALILNPNTGIVQPTIYSYTITLELEVEIP